MRHLRSVVVAATVALAATANVSLADQRPKILLHLVNAGDLAHRDVQKWSTVAQSISGIWLNLIGMGDKPVANTAAILAKTGSQAVTLPVTIRVCEPADVDKYDCREGKFFLADPALGHFRKLRDYFELHYPDKPTLKIQTLAINTMKVMKDGRRKRDLLSQTIEIIRDRVAEVPEYQSARVDTMLHANTSASGIPLDIQAILTADYGNGQKNGVVVEMPPWMLDVGAPINREGYVEIRKFTKAQGLRLVHLANVGLLPLNEDGHPIEGAKSAYYLQHVKAVFKSLASQNLMPDEFVVANYPSKDDNPEDDKILNDLLPLTPEATASGGFPNSLTGNMRYVLMGDYLPLRAKK